MADDCLNFLLENMINVPKITGTFYTRWKVSADGRIIGKGRTTNAAVSNFKVSWNEVFKLELVKKDSALIEIDLVACELENNGDSKVIGNTRLAFPVGDHSVGNENSALLLENSKFNAALRVSTWFGFQKPEVMLEKIINQMNAPKSVRIEGDDTDSDYSCSTEEHLENKRLIDEVFS